MVVVARIQFVNPSQPARTQSLQRPTPTRAALAWQHSHRSFGPGAAGPEDLPLAHPLFQVKGPRVVEPAHGTHLGLHFHPLPVFQNPDSLRHGEPHTPALRHLQCELAAVSMPHRRFGHAPLQCAGGQFARGRRAPSAPLPIYRTQRHQCQQHARPPEPTPPADPAPHADNAEEQHAHHQFPRGKPGEARQQDPQPERQGRRGQGVPHTPN